MLRMCSREDALRAVVFDHMGYGKIESLQKKIGEAMFNDFCNLGYVQEIMPSNMYGNPVLWKRTKIADEDYKFYDPDFDSVKRGVCLQVTNLSKHDDKAFSAAQYIQVKTKLSPAIKAKLIGINKRKRVQLSLANTRGIRGLKEKNDIFYFSNPDDIK